MKVELRHLDWCWAVTSSRERPALTMVVEILESMLVYFRIIFEFVPCIFMWWRWFEWRFFFLWLVATIPLVVTFCEAQLIRSNNTNNKPNPSIDRMLIILMHQAIG